MRLMTDEPSTAVTIRCRLQFKTLIVMLSIQVLGYDGAFDFGYSAWLDNSNNYHIIS